MLNNYSWPGNIRELEHTIERILILEAPEVILPEHLPSYIVQNDPEYQIFSPESCTLQDLEKRHIQFTLGLTKGNRQEAARILGINRKTLSQKIKKYSLQAPFRGECSQ